MKKTIILAAVVALMTACNNQPQTTEATETKEEMKQELNLTQEWDKVFPLSDKVNHRKVTFETQYGLTLAADLYEPKEDGSQKTEDRHWHSTHRLLERVGESLAVQPRPTSTPRTSWPQSISCQNKTT